MSRPRVEATEEQRQAQKRVGAYLRTRGYLTQDGVAFWQERDAGEWKASAEEISEDLQVLGVASTTVTALRPPTARSRVQREGREVRVATADLPALGRWSPMLEKSVAQLPPDAPGFTFVYLAQQPDGMVALRKAPFAADWHSWTPNQATAMGLVCPRCGHDLREPRDGQLVPAINRPLPGRPRRRLFCFGCEDLDG